MLNTRGVSSFNDLNTKFTRILVHKTCILFYFMHGPPVFSILAPGRHVESRRCLSHRRPAGACRVRVNCRGDVPMRSGYARDTRHILARTRNLTPERCAAVGLRSFPLLVTVQKCRGSEFWNTF